MSNISRLIRVTAADDTGIYFANAESEDFLRAGAKVQGYPSIDALTAKKDGKEIVIAKLLAPTQTMSNPIYCVGLNYRNHVEEAGLTVPKAPAVWLKPAAAWANPEETIPVNKWCSDNFMDYEGELTFITSKEARDVSAAEAAHYILGYTCGNDLTSRLHQDPSRSGGQFTYAKGFDKFAPVGPCLVPPSRFTISQSSVQTRVNGKVMQDSFLDFVFSPEEILSHISQGTTIPAGTAVMTGTPGGVGWFRKPQVSLKDGDKVEVEISGLGTLRNTIQYV